MACTFYKMPPGEAVILSTMTTRAPSGRPLYRSNDRAHLRRSSLIPRECGSSFVPLANCRGERFPGLLSHTHISRSLRALTWSSATERLQRALKRATDPKTRQPIRMVSVRETRMTRPEIADDGCVSLTTVNRRHIRRVRGARTEAERRMDPGKI